MIGIIDYRAGNAPSVLYALNKLEIPARLISTAAEISSSDRLVLPGVGSARATMDSLRQAGLIETLDRRVRADGIPFLGICVGLQVLFEHSEEDDTPCLGWFPGTVRRFANENRVPQMGWNQVRFTRPHPVLQGLPEPAYLYFVNSYYAVPDDSGMTLGETDYGVAFASMVARTNVVASQFHVEKSGPVGLTMLANFATFDGGEQC